MPGGAFKILFSIILPVFFFAPAPAQEVAEVPDTFKVSARVEGMGPMKFLVAGYTYISAAEITSTPQNKNIAGAAGTIRKLEEIGGKAYAPLLLKPKTNIILGVKYFYEEYTFDDKDDYAFYRSLHDKHLNSLTISIAFSRVLSRNRFLVARPGVALNGDYSNDEVSLLRFAKGSLQGLYGWKKSARFAYGFGFIYSYDLGGPSFYPAVLFNKTFNSRWGIESLFPANLKLRYNISAKSIFYIGHEVGGASYQLVIEEPPLSDIPTLELRKSRVRLQATLDQRLLSFLGLSVSAGYNFNINFNLAEQNSFGQKVLMRNKAGHSPFFQAMVFFTVPDDLKDKYRK